MFNIKLNLESEEIFYLVFYLANMGGVQYFVLIAGRCEDIGENQPPNDRISTQLFRQIQFSSLLIARNIFLMYSPTIKCPHLCAISHKIFMHHKILNGQEYKEKNAALCHYFVVVQQCIQNKICPTRRVFQVFYYMDYRMLALPFLRPCQHLIIIQTTNETIEQNRKYRW